MNIKEIEKEFDDNMNNNLEWSERPEGGNRVNDEKIKSFYCSRIKELLEESRKEIINLLGKDTDIIFDKKGKPLCSVQAILNKIKPSFFQDEEKI